MHAECRRRPERDHQSVPRIDIGDDDRKVHNLSFGEMRLHNIPYRIRNVVFVDSGQAVRPRERGPFLLRKSWRLLPAGQGIELVLRHPRSPRPSIVEVEAEGAPIDLRGPQSHKFHQRRRERSASEVASDFGQSLGCVGRHHVVFNAGGHKPGSEAPRCILRIARAGSGGFHNEDAFFETDRVSLLWDGGGPAHDRPSVDVELAAVQWACHDVPGNGPLV
jgi:hypothetical protein